MSAGGTEAERMLGTELKRQSVKALESCERVGTLSSKSMTLNLESV